MSDSALERSLVIGAPLERAQQSSATPAWKIFLNMRRSFATTAHHAILVLGIMAISILVMAFIKPELIDRIQALSPFIAPEPAATVESQAARDQAALADADQALRSSTANSSTNPVLGLGQNLKNTSGEADHQQQQWVTQWLSKRYRVAHDATNVMVSASYSTAKEMKLDPLLILAVMAIESGLNPFAESPVGAQGLMQVMSNVHHDKFQKLGGVKAALNPIANIKVGSLILKDYVTRGGSVEAGLKMYVGAAAFANDSGYGYKVLAEYRRLKEVALGRKVPVITARAAPVAKPKPVEAAADLAIEAENHVNQQPKQSQLTDDQVAAL